MKNVKEMIKNLSVGDIVDITISDCGKGHAVIMDVSNDEITIKVDVDTFTCCYDCQTLVNSIFSVKVEEVYEINKIKEDNKMKTNFNSLKVGDTINITIKNCGSGIATIMYVKNSFRENYITIRMYRNTFIPCCNGQSIDNPFMVVDIDDIEQLEIIEDVYKELNDELIKRKLIYGPSYEENDCSEAVLSEVYDWGFAIYRRDETGQFYLFYDNNYELITSVCVESEYYEITGNFKVLGNILAIKTSDGKVNKYNFNKEDNNMSKNVNVHAAGYLTKDKIREQIEALEGKPMSNHEFKSTKRDKLLEMLEKAKAQQPTIAEATKEVAPAQLDKRREKYNLFCHLVKTKALENQKKGYGHVVSAYMLCALILKADCGLEKLKGNEDKVTDEQRAKVKEIRNFMISKGHLKAVTWSYNNVTYYSSEYDGNNKNFMVPVEKAPKDAKLVVTTYKVMW